MIRKTLSALIALLLTTVAAKAATATLDFDAAMPAPFATIDQRIVSGNCADGQCDAINRNETFTILTTNGSTFTVDSFWFQILGANKTMTVKTNKGAHDLPEGSYPHNNGGQLLDVTGDSSFTDITSISFTMSGGNGRVDDIVVLYDDGGSNIVASVPLPMSALLMAGALGGLALVRRRA